MYTNEILLGRMRYEYQQELKAKRLREGKGSWADQAKGGIVRLSRAVHGLAKPKREKPMMPEQRVLPESS